MQGNRMNIVEAINFHVFPSSSPLEGEDNAALFSYFTKIEPREVGGLFLNESSGAIPPTPSLPLKGGGRETREN